MLYRSIESSFQFSKFQKIPTSESYFFRTRNNSKTKVKYKKKLSIILQGKQFFFERYEDRLCRSKRSPAGVLTAGPLFFVFCQQLVFNEKKKREKVHKLYLACFSIFDVSTNFHYDHTSTKEKLNWGYGPFE